MRSMNRMRDEFIAFELNAVSLLARHWAEKCEDGRWRKEMAKKIQPFRSAVIAGACGRPGIAHELVQCEFDNALRWATRAKQELDRSDPEASVQELVSQGIPYRLVPARGRCGDRHRPVLLDDEGLLARLAAQILDDPERVAASVMRRRFGHTRPTVVRVLAIPSRVERPSQTQRYFAATYLDLAVSSRTPDRKLMALVLDALLALDYSPFLMYHLLQAGTVLDCDDSLGALDVEAIRSAAKAILEGPLHKERGSFSGLFAG